ncbi:MAG: hypothetical protein K2I00_03030 [Ruminococcus sp.]|nr:hypothetical protein [Ruminococcus sp.]
MNEFENKLHLKVNAFKIWAKTNYPEITEDNDNGEWCFCDEFDEMYESALSIIQKSSASNATEQIINDLLYAIARDNECENIVEVLVDYDDWFALLCRYSLKSPYTNAKWQFAVKLKNYKCSNDLKDLIFEFLSTGDEYTERLALQSLAYIYPEQAEKYAVEFWNRNKYEYDEYQKIMVLHVLYQIHSPNLKLYLEMAENLNYKYLKENAQEISRKLKTDNSVN